MNSIWSDIDQWKYENIGNWPLDFTEDRLLPMQIRKYPTIRSNYRQIATKASKTSWTLKQIPSRYVQTIWEEHQKFGPRSKCWSMKLWEPKRKCPKAVPRHIPKSCSVVTGPKCSVKSYVIVLSTKCYFNEFYSSGSSHMMKCNKSIVVRFRSAMVTRFCDRPTSKRWFLKIVQVTVKHDPFDAM